MTIEMKIVRKNGDTAVFKQELEKETDPAVLNSRTDLPDWAKLECNQCPHCPLSPSDSTWCPAAAAIAPVIDGCADWSSIEPVELETIESTRRTIEQMDSPDALCAIIVNQTAFSACPVLKFDFWAWKYFSPTISMDNIIFRHMAIRQIYVQLSEVRGREIKPRRMDFATLSNTLENLITRLRKIPDLRGDAILNALVKIHAIVLYATDFTDSLYDQLEASLNEDVDQ